MAKKKKVVRKVRFDLDPNSPNNILVNASHKAHEKKTGRKLNVLESSLDERTKTSNHITRAARSLTTAAKKRANKHGVTIPTFSDQVNSVKKKKKKGK
jgi:hypothetical protein